MNDVVEKAKQIKLIIFDVDGVLTNGQLFFGDDGQEYKAFNSQDGHGMKMLQESGVDIGIITGRTSRVVEHRAKNLGIKHVYQGQLEKLPAFEKLISDLNLSPNQVAYAGDDVVDLPVMLRVGLAISVPGAHELARKHAHWVTESSPGFGAAREICEFILKAQENYESAISKYFL